MSKKLHVNCFPVPGQYVEGFLLLVEEYNNPSMHEEYQAEDYQSREPLVEILYQEEGRGTVPTVSFDLWFATPSAGFYFGLAWARRLVELEKTAKELLAHANATAAYPQFLYHPKLRYWLRYNSPEYFCIVEESELQVRRERAQELFKPDEVGIITEANFLENYRRISTLLREQAEHYLATYQRRGSEGNEWFYCNLIYAGGESRVQKHLRLNVSANDCGRSWQLLYDHDRHWNDQRRVASNQQEFEQQLHALLREAEAAATGQEGGQNNG